MQISVGPVMLPAAQSAPFPPRKGAGLSPGDDEQRAVVVVASTARWRGEKKEVVIRDDRERKDSLVCLRKGAKLERSARMK